MSNIPNLPTSSSDTNPLPLSSALVPSISPFWNAAGSYGDPSSRPWDLEGQSPLEVTTEVMSQLSHLIPTDYVKFRGVKSDFVRWKSAFLMFAEIPLDGAFSHYLTRGASRQSGEAEYPASQLSAFGQWIHRLFILTVDYDTYCDLSDGLDGKDRCQIWFHAVKVYETYTHTERYNQIAEFFGSTTGTVEKSRRQAFAFYRTLGFDETNPAKLAHQIRGLITIIRCPSPQWNSALSTYNEAEFPWHHPGLGFVGHGIRCVLAHTASTLPASAAGSRKALSLSLESRPNRPARYRHLWCTFCRKGRHSSANCRKRKLVTKSGRWSRSSLLSVYGSRALKACLTQI